MIEPKRLVQVKKNSAIFAKKGAPSKKILICVCRKQQGSKAFTFFRNTRSRLAYRLNHLGCRLGIRKTKIS